MTTSEKARPLAPLADAGGRGTGVHKYGDAAEAYRSVPAAEKRRAFIMLGAAGVTLAAVFLTRLLWLFEPVLDLIYYGTLSETIYYITLGVLSTVYIVFLNIFVKKYCGERIFLPRKGEMSITSLLAMIAVAAVTVFVTSAGFGFKLKLQVEMGTGVTMATALVNIAVYFYYAFHLWLALAAATLVQRALSVLVPAKFTVPWGSVMLVAVFGVLELVFEAGTTDHLYPWLYFLFTFVYALAFELSEHRFHTTFWFAVVVMVL